MSNQDDENIPVESGGSDSLKGGIDDDIDEELIALAGPPPSLRWGLFTGVVVALLISMMVWFYPELEYALQIADDPTPLGEAADLDLKELKSNRYVKVEGLPHVTQSIKYKEGIRWFSMSDNTRHFFPLTGQPHLYVQWKETDEYKAFRDPDTNPTRPERPSSFSGHLVKREDLVGANYERVLVFYDCLKLHPLRRCNTCLGQASLEMCREFFTCVERNPPEACVTLMKHLEDPKAVSADQLTLSLREHRIEVQLMRLEELSVRVARLLREKDLTNEEKGVLEALKKEILAIQIDELKVRAALPLKKISGLNDEERTALTTTLAALEAGTKREGALKKRQKLLNEYADAGQALENIVIRLGKMKGIVMTAKAGQLEGFGQWKLDAASGDGETLTREIDRFEAYLFSHVAKASEKAETLDAAHENFVAILDELRRRLKTLQSRVTGLEPGLAPAFDAWVRRPDVVVGMPSPEVKDTRTLRSLPEIEKMLEKVAPSTDNWVRLVERVNRGIDEMALTKKKNQQLRATPGLREMEVATSIYALAGAAKDGGDVAALTVELGRVTLLLMERKLYPSSLEGMKAEMARIEKRASEAVVTGLESRLDGVANRFDSGDFVLFDEDPPLEKTWVLVIYLILVLMLIINLRKLWCFVVAWKS